MGSGAMACYFAAQLSASGHPVTLLSEWKEGVSIIQKNGVRLIDERGKLHAYPVQAFTEPARCKKHALALVLVKSWQTAEAAEMLVHCLEPQGVALTLQNGLGNLEVLAKILGTERAVCGSTTIGATLLEPGLAKAGGAGKIDLPDQDNSRRFVDIFNSIQIPVNIQANFRSIVWGKLIVNASINPLTALLDVPNGALLENQSAHQAACLLALESSQVAAAGKIELPYPDPIEYVDTVIRKTATNSSSMRQDMRRGAPTEINAITGSLISYGNKWGVNTPHNQMVFHLVKARLAENS